MAKRYGKHKVSTRERDLLLRDTENNSPSSLAVTGAATVGGTLVVGTDGSGTDVTFHSGTASDNFLWDASAEALILTGTAGQNTLQVADGDVLVTKGNVVLGANGSQAGNLTLWDKDSSNPAWILLHSCDGTAGYFFLANDGTLKTHTAAPTANGDGSAV